MHDNHSQETKSLKKRRYKITSAKDESLAKHSSPSLFYWETATSLEVKIPVSCTFPLMARSYTLASSLANGTINSPGKQQIFPTQTSTNTQEAETVEVGAWKSLCCLIIHIRKQLANSKKGNKTQEFSTDSAGAIF